MITHPTKKVGTSGRPRVMFIPGRRIRAALGELMPAGPAFEIVSGMSFHVKTSWHSAMER